jgi:hypothetical protein
MGITVLPLTMTAGFLTDTVDLSETNSPPGVSSPPLLTRFHHTHSTPESAWRKYQGSGHRLPRMFHSLLHAAGPLKTLPTIMPPHIIEDINRRREEANIDRRPYAPSPSPPENFPPGYERPEGHHHSNIDGDSHETGERGIVIIDFEI